MLSAAALPSGPAAGQIRTDGSLGPAARTLTGPNFTIGADLGRQVNGNLFHSFSSFNLQTSQGVTETATFTGPASVQNIIGRVTGGQTSRINGRIASSIPGANLFLLNPSGWVFGRNASIDVGGAFHVSTADYLRFADNARFQATTANGSSLTAAAPEAFGFLHAQPGAIRIHGSTLDTTVGKNLSIVGGGVHINGADVAAPAGQLQIASAAGAGEISLDAADPAKQTVSSYGPIRVTGGTLVNKATGQSSGSVYVRGGAVTVRGSTIQAPNYGGTTGGGILVQADVLRMQAGSIVSAALGTGDAGPIAVTATHGITITGDGQGLLEGISSVVVPGASGNAGAVSVVSGGNITVRSDSQISSRTFGRGNAGLVTVTAAGSAAGGGTDGGTGTDGGRGTGATSTITLDGGLLSGDTGILASAEQGSTGAAGQVVVSADTIRLLRTGEIDTSSSGPGAPGMISVTANQVVLDNLGRTNGASGLFSDSNLPASTKGGGAITIRANTLALHPGGEISSSTFGAGAAGSVMVTGTGTAPTITIDGGDARVSTGIFAETEARSSGAAGQISVSADTIQLLRAGEMTASSSGTGAAGTIDVTARDFLADGTGITGISTGLFANAKDPQAAGTAGTITLHTNTLSLLNRGVISSSSFGDGAAGSVTVTGTGSRSAITIDGTGSDVGSATSIANETGIVAKAEGAGTTGSAGQVTIAADTISLFATGQISTSSAGQGAAGKIDVTAGQIIADGAKRTDASTGIFSLAQTPGTSSSAGDITVRANAIRLTSRGTITSDTASNGKAGTVTVIGTGANSSIVIDGGASNDGSDLGTGIASNAEMGSRGPGGQVTVSADNITLLRTGTISTITDGEGPAGAVSVTAHEITANGGGRTDAATSIASDSNSLTAGAVQGGTPDAGDVTVRADQITLLDRGAISSSSFGVGRGGNVTILPDTRPADILVTGDGSGIRALSTGPLSAGVVDVTANTLTLRDNGLITTFAAQGGGGNLAVRTGQLLYLNRGGIITSVLGGSGSGGNITTVAPFTVLDHGVIQANAVAGRGGNISITANQYFATPDSLVQASSQLGINGTINILAPDTNVAGTLAELPGRLLSLPNVQRQGCSGAARSEGTSSLTLGGRGDLPRDGEGPQQARYFDAGSPDGTLAAARRGTSPQPAGISDAASPVRRVAATGLEGGIRLALGGPDVPSWACRNGDHAAIPPPTRRTEAARPSR